MHRFHFGALHMFSQRICGLTSMHQVGRMMMNIRGLIPEDPENVVHLSSSQFLQDPNLGLQIEEGGEVA